MHGGCRRAASFYIVLCRKYIHIYTKKYLIYKKQEEKTMSKLGAKKKK